MSKFTPGPWIVIDDDWSDGDDLKITCEEREERDFKKIEIAMIRGAGSNSDFDDLFAEEQRGNARLISAAPELLSALREILSKKGSRWHPTDPIAEKARVAITKATGEE